MLFANNPPHNPNDSLCIELNGEQDAADALCGFFCLDIY